MNLSFLLAPFAYITFSFVGTLLAIYVNGKWLHWYTEGGIHVKAGTLVSTGGEPCIHIATDKKVSISGD